jgi:putative membrane protein
VSILADGMPGHGDALSFGSVLPLAVLAAVALGYIAMAAARSQEPRGWNHWRTASFVMGVTLLVVALEPSESEDFGDHMIGHLLIGMFAPLALVLAAPVTLILRTVNRKTGKTIVHALRSTPARILTNPIVLLTANLGGLALLYFTPLYISTTSNMLLHEAVHIHFFITGYLFAWMIAGPDSGPERPSVPIRLIVLGITVAGHSVIAQLLYAGIFVNAPFTADELRDGGTLMYYWGDIAEILLALAMLLRWRPAARRTRDRLDARPRARILSDVAARRV